MRNLLLFLLLLTLGAVFCGGCFQHIGTISPDITPAVKGTVKPGPKTAVYFSPQLVQCEVAASPETSQGRRHKYYYHLGPALEKGLTESVKRAYQDVSVVKVLPRPGSFDRIISFQLEKANVRLKFIPGYLRQLAKAEVTIAVILEVIDGTSLKTLRKMPVTGRGSSLKDASGFTPYASLQFTKAMEEATQQLAEITANLLISGGAEVKSR
jgi:hypothetical protein